MLRNPYLNRSAIRSLDGFFGRQREIGRVMGRVGASTPQSVSVIGERRVGKSSLLWHLCQPEVQARHLEAAPDYAFVRLDLQGQQHFDEPRFCQEFLRLVQGAVAGRAAVEPGADLAALEAAASVLEARGVRLVCLFDEFEAITRNPAFDRRFFGFLRSLASAHPVAYITASQRPLQDLCRSREIAESPFFNIFAQVRLGPLQDDEAADLIRRPSEVAGLPLEPHQPGLLELGGHLPLFLQMACCALFEQLVDGRDPPAWPDVEAAFLEEAEPHYAYLWERSSEAERSALARIAAGCPPTPEDAPAIERLFAQGYLTRQERRTAPFCGSFARFVLRAGGVPPAVGPAPAAVAAIAPEPAAAASVEVEPTPIGTQPYPRLLGQSLALRRVLALVQRAIASDVSVVLTGETGTGKELVARTIHEGGLRRERAFVAVNCGSIAESLQESELFGHKKGAFTDAVADRAGLFETADGGTLFLDEIGDTSPATQVRLLRALQSGEVRRLGENQARSVDVRLICATNRDLEGEMRAGRFRDDLYYRLYVLAIHLPPLRARQGDIALLVQHFLEPGLQRVSDEAMACLEAYAWPGNIRELANQVASARAMAGGDVIEARHLWVRVRQAAGVASPGPYGAEIDPGLSLKEARECFERAYLQARLQACSWRLEEAARSLGVSRSRLYELVRQYGLRGA